MICLMLDIGFLFILDNRIPDHLIKKEAQNLGVKQWNRDFKDKSPFFVDEFEKSSD